MKMILRVFARDLQLLTRNPIALVVAIGLAVIPALYAWFNIAANWDPYGSTSGISVAVVNLDAGYTAPHLSGLELNVGQQVTDNLRENDQIGWVFVDEEAALEGVRAGQYYAAVLIPADFSQKIASVLTDDIENPCIEYYVNEKKNAIAPKITNSGVTVIQKQVNSTFIQVASQTLLSLVNDVSGELDELELNPKNDLQQTVTAARSDLGVVSSSLTVLADGLDSASALLASVSALLPNVDSALSRAGSDARALATLTDDIQQLTAPLDELSEQAQQDSEQLREQTAAARAALKQLSYAPEELLALLDAVDKFNDEHLLSLYQTYDDEVRPALDELHGHTQDALDELNSTLAAARADLAALDSSLSSGQSALAAIVSALRSSADSIDRVSERLGQINAQVQSAAGGELADTLLRVVQNDPEKVGEFMYSPVTLNTHTLYPIENYGSAMTPFYSTLAFWVGGIVLVAILKVRVAEEGKLRGLRPYQSYLGRYLIFWFLGFVQSSIICLGDLFFLDVQCLNPGLFLLSGWISSLVYTFIIYTLTVSFSDIGKALCVILLVIQIAGAGGTFPIEVTPQFFQNVYPFLPFTYGINAMRETVAGMYGAQYWLDLLRLLAYIPFCLVLGLLLRNPLIRLNQFFEDRMEDTKLM